MRCSGAGMRTRRSISIARPRASRGLVLRWRRMPSTIWSPMVKAGLSEVIGSWKIIDIWLPRNSRSAAAVSARDAGCTAIVAVPAARAIFILGPGRRLEPGDLGVDDGAIVGAGWRRPGRQELLKRNEIALRLVMEPTQLGERLVV